MNHASPFDKSGGEEKADSSPLIATLFMESVDSWGGTEILRILPSTIWEYLFLLDREDVDILSISNCF